MCFISGSFLRSSIQTLTQGQLCLLSIERKMQAQCLAEHHIEKQALRDCESGGEIVRRTVERVTDKGSWSLAVQADNWQLEPMQPEVRLSLTDGCFRSTQLVAGFSDPDITWLGYVFLVRR